VSHLTIILMIIEHVMEAEPSIINIWLCVKVFANAVRTIARVIDYSVGNCISAHLLVTRWRYRLDPIIMTSRLLGKHGV